MITLINSEKLIDKIQYPFIPKNVQKVGKERTYFNIKKAIYNKPTTNITLNGKKSESTSYKNRNKTKMSNHVTFMQHSTGSPSDNNQTRKRNFKKAKVERNK